MNTAAPAGTLQCEPPTIIPSIIPISPLSTPTLLKSDSNSTTEFSLRDGKCEKYRKLLFQIMKQSRLSEMNMAQREHEEKILFDRRERELKLKYYQEHEELKLMQMREEHEIRMQHIQAEHDARLRSYTRRRCYNGKTINKPVSTVVSEQVE